MAENIATTNKADCLSDKIQHVSTVLEGLGEMMDGLSGDITDATTMSMALILRDLSSKLFDVYWRLVDMEKNNGLCMEK